MYFKLLPSRSLLSYLVNKNINSTLFVYETSSQAAT